MLWNSQRRCVFLCLPSYLDRSRRLTRTKKFKLATKLSTNTTTKKRNDMTSSDHESNNNCLTERYRSVSSAIEYNELSHKINNNTVCSSSSSNVVCAFTPLYRRSRFPQQLAQICTTRDPVVLLASYIQAAGRHSDLLNEFPLLPHTSLSFNHYKLKNNNYNITKVANSFFLDLAHVLRITQQMAACVGASVIRAVWPKWVLFYYSSNEQELTTPQKWSCCDLHQSDLLEHYHMIHEELLRLHARRYRVGLIDRIAEHYIFTPLVIEARCLLKATTQEIVEVYNHFRLRESDSNEQNCADNVYHKKECINENIDMLDVLRLFAALCAICIAPSLDSAVNLSRNVIETCPFATAMVGVALRTFCYANQSWERNKNSKVNNDNSNDNSNSSSKRSDNVNVMEDDENSSIEQLWLHLWNNIVSVCQINKGNYVTEGYYNFNMSNESIDDDDDDDDDVDGSSSHQSYLRFVLKEVGLDNKAIEQEFFNWHVHCLLSTQRHTSSVMLSLEKLLFLSNTLEKLQEDQEEEQEEQEQQQHQQHVLFEFMKSVRTRNTLTASLTRQEELQKHEAHMLNELSVQCMLELFSLAPLAWLHTSKLYSRIGNIVLLIIVSEHKQLSTMQRLEECNKTKHHLRTRRLKFTSVLNTHTNLFNRAIHYALYKLATATVAKEEIKAYEHVIYILEMCNVKALTRALMRGTPTHVERSNHSNRENNNERMLTANCECHPLHELVIALHNVIYFVCNKSTRKASLATATSFTENINWHNDNNAIRSATENVRYNEIITGDYKVHSNRININNSGSCCTILYTNSTSSDESNKNNDVGVNESNYHGTDNNNNYNINNISNNATESISANWQRSALQNDMAYSLKENVCMYDAKLAAHAEIEENELGEVTSRGEEEKEDEDVLLVSSLRNQIILLATNILCKLISNLASKISYSSNITTRYTNLYSQKMISSHYSQSASESNKYEIMWCEWPHELIRNILESLLLSFNYTAEARQLCTCIIEHDVIDLRYYNLPFIHYLCKLMESNEHENVNVTVDKVTSQEHMTTNCEININTYNKLCNNQKQEDEKKFNVNAKLQALYKRRKEVFGETLDMPSTSCNSSPMPTTLDLSSSIAVSSHASSSLNVWGLPCTTSSHITERTNDAMGVLSELDKSQACLYARRVASLYQLHDEPHVVSLLHGLLTRISPLLGGGFTIDRRTHYNFGKWEVKGTVSTAPS